MDTDNRLRKKLDPEGRYLGDGLRQMDEHAERLLAPLPAASVDRTRDAIQITVDDDLEDGVVLILTPEALELRLPSMDWVQPHWAVPTSRLWKRLKWERISEDGLRELVEQAREKRRAEHRECRFCHGRFPPEQRHDRDVCHGCAERHLLIVH